MPSRRDMLSQGLSAIAATSLPVAPAGLSSPRRIALTFDDVPRDRGPFLSTSERTERLITGLKAEGVEQAAFFAVPGFIEELGKSNGAAHIAAYARAGHVIGNHTWDHPRLSQISAEEFTDNIAQAERWLHGKPGYRPWFRFPYLDQAYAQPRKSRKVAHYLRKAGLADAWVTVDGSDWAFEDHTLLARKRGARINHAALKSAYLRTMIEAAEFYDRLAISLLGHSPAHVMLLHEADVTALYLPSLIRALRRNGWTLVPIDEAYADPLYQTLPLGSAQDMCGAHAARTRCINSTRMGYALATGPTLLELMAWAAGRRRVIHHSATGGW